MKSKTSFFHSKTLTWEFICYLTPFTQHTDDLIHSSTRGRKQPQGGASERTVRIHQSQRGRCSSASTVSGSGSRATGGPRGQVSNSEARLGSQRSDSTSTHSV